MQDGLALIGGGFQPRVEVAPNHEIGDDKDVVHALPCVEKLCDKQGVDGLKDLAVEREHKTHSSKFWRGALLMLILIRSPLL